MSKFVTNFVIKIYVVNKELLSMKIKTFMPNFFAHFLLYLLFVILSTCSTQGQGMAHLKNIFLANNTKYLNYLA